ncbi:MAG: type I restriction enzyme HsdR N-terminal domain-containing protein [Chitinophagales bacterium]|nr:type I restriction enzyme HsdR N-terminal domain-containing protein [Chitinophagaceae bacterium]MCB9064571.1 type I restriction enzyme HsdR N-terminal domain-containing protein [Chitinophagales bacterium]
MINVDFTEGELKLKREDGKVYVHDPIRKKWLILTPEEHVRQYVLQYFINKLNYPSALISVEKQINVGTLSKRFDVVVYDRDHKPWLLVECKAPEVNIGDSTLHQLLQYHNTMQCNYWLVTNGHQTYCADACNLPEVKWMNELPAYEF